MKETLTETVLRECRECEPVMHAWVAGDSAFAIQTRVTLKRSVKRGDDGEWTYIEPKYASSAAYRMAEAMVARIVGRHPGASSTLVTYPFRAHGRYVEVYRGAPVVKKDEEDE